MQLWNWVMFGAGGFVGLLLLTVSYWIYTIGYEALLERLKAWFNPKKEATESAKI
jgi:hypothetical protein